MQAYIEVVCLLLALLLWTLYIIAQCAPVIKCYLSCKCLGNGST